MNHHALVKPLTPPAKGRLSFNISDVNTSIQLAPHKSEYENWSASHAAKILLESGRPIQVLRLLCTELMHVPPAHVIIF